MFRSVSSPPCLQWLWYSPDILSSENQKLFFFPEDKGMHRLKPSVHFHLVLRCRIHRASPPHLCFCSMMHVVHFNGVRLRLWTVATSRPIVHPADHIWVSSHGVIDKGKPKNWRKICPNAILSTTNPTWTDLGLFSERLANDRLSRGMAL
jgi:hypothetical protein